MQTIDPRWAAAYSGRQGGDVKVGLFDRLRAEPVYNTRAVVQQTGVPADTFRAWERRYGIPRPQRTSGNQRLYCEQDSATIAWLRDQTRAGLTISQAVALFRSREAEPSIDRLAESREGEGRFANGEGEERLGRLRRDVVSALLQFDAAEAERILEDALAMLQVEEICLHILQPVLYEIGHLWAAGEVEISAEHFASAFVLRKLGALFNLSQPDLGRGPVVATCLEGELHEVGLLLGCLFLSRRGFQIVYLGANLPLDDLVRTTQRLRPPLVVLSASTPESARRLALDVREFRQRCLGANGRASGFCPAIAYGGYAFITDPSLRTLIDGKYFGANADEAVEVVDRLLVPATGVIS